MEEWVFESTKHFWSLRGKTVLKPNPVQLKLLVSDSSNVKKKNYTEKQIASVVSAKCP